MNAPPPAPSSRYSKQPIPRYYNAAIASAARQQQVNLFGAPTPWTQGDITQANAGALMDEISGNSPTSLMPFHDLNAPGTVTARRQRHERHSNGDETREALIDTVTHRGADGLQMDVEVNRQRWTDANGAHEVNEVNVKTRQPWYKSIFGE